MAEAYHPNRPIWLPPELVRKLEDARARMGELDLAIMNESDRGAILVMVEEFTRMLRRLLVLRLSKMDEADWEAHFDRLAGGGLRNFAGRISAAVRLGLLSDRQAQMLRALAELRNAVAHRPLQATFQTQEVQEKFDAWVATPFIAEVAAKMGCDPEVRTGLESIRAQAPDLLARFKFVAYCGAVRGTLQGLIERQASADGSPSAAP